MDTNAPAAAPLATSLDVIAMTTTAATSSVENLSARSISLKFDAFRALRDVEQMLPKFTAIDVENIRQVRAALQRADAVLFMCETSIARDLAR